MTDPTGPIAAGLRRGLFYAAVCIIWVSAGTLLSDGANLRAKGVTFAPLVLAYAFGMPLIGVIIGALNRYRRTILGRAMIGFVAGVPFAILMILSMTERLSLKHWILGSVISAAIVGVPMGVIWLRPRA